MLDWPSNGCVKLFTLEKLKALLKSPPYKHLERNALQRPVLYLLHCLSMTENPKFRNKYVFRVKKKLVELQPQLELLAVFIRKSGHDNMSKQYNHIQNEQTQFHSGMGTQIHCALIFPSLNPSSYTKQSGRACYTA